MTERLSAAQVRRIARLARLALDDDEVLALTAQLGEVLDYVELLRAAPTADVPPTAHPLDVPCPLRADEPAPPEDPAPLLRNAPALARGAFVVPRVVERDEE
jgi:aspartyl/glutamyl-tRNA(Asn/Gln) amidotransferase C subunit